MSDWIRGNHLGRVVACKVRARPDAGDLMEMIMTGHRLPRVTQLIVCRPFKCSGHSEI